MSSAWGALILCSALAAAPAPAPARLKIAVLALQGGPGEDAKTADLVSETFVATLQQRRGFQVLSSKDIALALGFERQRQLLGCNESSCLAELGGSLGVDYLVTGTVGRLGGTLVFNVQALNMHTNVVDQRYSQRLKAGNEEALLDLLGPAVDALFPNAGTPVVTPVATAAADAGGVAPFPVTSPPVAPGAGLAAAALKPGLAGVHPRLSFLAQDVTGIRVRTSAPELKDEWRDLLAMADERRDPKDLPRAGDALPLLSIAYLGTGNPSYRDAARHAAAMLASADAWPGDGELEGATLAYVLAQAYDWLYADLSERERASFAAALQKHGALLYERGLHPKGWSAAWQSSRGVQGYAALAVVALAIIDGAPAAQAWLDLARARMDAVAGHLDPDGADHEGPNATARTLWWLVHYADVLEHCTGSEEGFRIGWLRAHVRYRAYALMPDGKNLPPFGDSSAGDGELVSDALSRLSSKYSDGLAAWLAAVDRKGRIHRVRPFDFIWPPGAPPKAPDSLPASAVFTDLGVAVLRTGWDRDAAVLAMKCGPPGGLRAVREAKGLQELTPDFGRDHPDASSFVFWQDRRWQVSSPGGDTRDKRTRNENVWLVSGRGQRGEGSVLDPSSYLGDGPQARLTHAGSSEGADFAVCEAGPAYEKAAGVTSLRRTVVLARGKVPYVLVLDRASTRVPQTFSAMLHAFSLFEVTPDATRFHLIGGVSGAFLAPQALRLDSHPLKVIDSRMKEVQRGFELEAQLPGAAKSAWLVTVLDKSSRAARVESAEAGPAVVVGSDRWSWDEAGIVSLGGQALATNLLK